MPHFALPQWSAAKGAQHHSGPRDQRLRRFENAIAYAGLGGAMILAAAMIYGLLSAGGEAPWF